MKRLLVIVVVSAIFAVGFCQDFTEEQKKRIIQNRQECVAETKVDPILIEKADLGEFPEDEKLKCFTKCFYQKAGFVNDKGEVQLDVVKAKIPTEADREQALKIVAKCQLKGKDPCETVYLIHKCYYTHTHPVATEEPAAKEKPNKTE
uniref:Odorant binding protein n=1 Tax=Cylas formicarius TaxID=197179 RepID=A0A6B7LZX0_CYLFO|nr:odorant binding protein [Cylas formicarius]QFO46780.1 odorant binding protein [Cylas formicarius]